VLIHPIIFKVEMVEEVRKSTPDMRFQVKMEMQMQSLELHTNLVLVVAVVDGVPLELLEETLLAARVAQTMLQVQLEVTLVLVAVVVARGKPPVEVALSES
jgi:hypothetical protein